jgi:amidophosphoribosyltransferase
MTTSLKYQESIDLPDRPREECGIFAVYGHEDAAKLTYFGLYALQHRGQESAGIVVSNGNHVVEHKAMGLVPDIFDEQILDKLKGYVALGHVRYSTTGSSLLVNAQPFRIQYAGKTLAIAHNGNLVNSRQIRTELEDDGSIFQTSMDTEIVLHLVAKSMKKGLEQAMLQTMKQVCLLHDHHDRGCPYRGARSSRIPTFMPWSFEFWPCGYL